MDSHPWRRHDAGGPAPIAMAPRPAPPPHPRRLPRLRPEWLFPALYLALSAAWILGSDQMVARLSGTVEQARLLSTYKGMAFIMGTTLLLHLGLRWALGRERRIARQARQAQEALRLSQEKFHRAFHAAPMLMALSRLEDGTFLEVNDLFCRVTGYTREEVLGRGSVELGYVAPADRKALTEALSRQGSVTNYELTTRAKSGRPILWLLCGEVLHFEGEAVLLSMATDITELRAQDVQRRELELQLHHLQRLETLGRLASGVSHDMNNVLAAIMGVASVMKMQHEHLPAIQREADLLLQAAGRGRDLVASLRDFSRRELGQTTSLDLNALVTREIQLLERTTLKKVNLVLDLQEDLPGARVEASSIANALMNLVVNACDAMPRGGDIRVSTRRAGLGFLELAVEDQGEGMSPEVLARAAEPFFTTKPAGQGTGLGLAQVAAAAKAHGGSMEIQSNVGRGTRIALFLPVGADEPHPPALVPTPQASPLPLSHLLLVDDDEMARSATAALLGIPGYQVAAFPGGPEALAHLSTGAPVDLAILDLNMPGMDGLATLEALRRQRPELPVLIATGFADNRIPLLLRQHPDVRLLQKPFTLAELQQALAACQAAARPLSDAPPRSHPGGGLPTP